MVAPPVPALPDAPRITTYAPVGAAGPFAVNFAIYGDSSDYVDWISVSLNGVDQSGAWVMDSPSGALITLPRPITDARITFTNAITGNLVITGAQRPRRTAQNSEGQGVTGRDWNQAITSIIAMLREAWDLRARTMLFPPGETAGLLPSLAQRALQLAGWDSLGNWIAAQPSSALVSSAMQPVVAAGSTAAALALLGAAPATSVMPIGVEADWPGLVLPPLWLPEDGSTRSRAGFPELFAVLAPTIATSGYGIGQNIIAIVGGTSMLAAGWPVEGAAFAPGTTIAAILDPNQIQLSAVTIAGGASVQFFPYGNGDGATTFTLPQTAGVVFAGIDATGVKLSLANAMNGSLGAQNITLTSAQIPAHSHPTTEVPHTHTLNNAGNVTTGSTFGTGAGTTGGANVAITVNAAATGLTVNNNVGGGGSHSNVQPTVMRRKIIYAGH